MFVLDFGCGTGAITAGIAKAVAPGGEVIGIDRDDQLLDIGRRQQADQRNLRFVTADLMAFEMEPSFDVVTAARTLQWVSDPEFAIRKMAGLCRPGGTVLVLDYDHLSNRWEPSPPAAFLRFYDAFLSWRDANGWDNRMAANLPDMVRISRLAEYRGQ